LFFFEVSEREGKKSERKKRARVDRPPAAAEHFRRSPGFRALLFLFSFFPFKAGLLFRLSRFFKLPLPFLCYFFRKAGVLLERDSAPSALFLLGLGGAFLQDSKPATTKNEEIDRRQRRSQRRGHGPGGNGHPPRPRPEEAGADASRAEGS